MSRIRIRGHERGHLVEILEQDFPSAEKLADEIFAAVMEMAMQRGGYTVVSVVPAWGSTILHGPFFNMGDAQRAIKNGLIPALADEVHIASMFPVATPVVAEPVENAWCGYCAHPKRAHLKGTRGRRCLIGGCGCRAKN